MLKNCLVKRLNAVTKYEKNICIESWNASSYHKSPQFPINSLESTSMAPGEGEWMCQSIIRLSLYYIMQYNTYFIQEDSSPLTP